MQGSRSRSLDFLRACAIALVITAHSVFAYGAPPALAPLQLGGTGVDLFFVLSGWLLGSQLIRELTRDGNIELKRFWIRRWMRTLPAYYAVLAVSMTQQVVMHPENPFRFDYLVFLQNYSGNLPFFGVSWSLCVEEHFYLLVGPAILALARLRIEWRWILVAILLCLPTLFRLNGWFGSIEETHVRWDGCMLGVALAVCRERLPGLWGQLTRFAPLLAGIAFVLFAANLADRYVDFLPIRDYDKSVYALIFAALLLLALRNDWWNHHLYLPGAHFIAVRAYSIYLVHPEVLALLKRVGPHLPFPVFYALAWLGSLALAEGLYRLVEKPVMDLRDRLRSARQPAVNANKA